MTFFCDHGHTRDLYFIPHFHQGTQSMPIKLNVGLSRKVGQPNFGSVGACCNVDIELDQQTIRDDPQVLHRRVQEAFAICRQAGGA